MSGMAKSSSIKGCAVVTGSSRGIGAATALALSGMGFPVVINYVQNHRAAKGLQAKIERGGGGAIVVRGDVAEAGTARTLMAEGVKAFKGIEALVNNAGFSSHFKPEALAAEEWERGVAVNLSAAFYCCQAALPHMKGAGRGRIVNIASLRAFTGSARGAHYSASKSGIAGLTKSLALDAGPYGITVNAVSPGYTLTEMTRQTLLEKEQEVLASIPLRRIGRAEEIASAVAFLCSEDAAYITGQVLHVNGGIFLG